MIHGALQLLLLRRCQPPVEGTSPQPSHPWTIAAMPPASPNDRADGKINLAGYDDHQHSDSENARDGSLAHKVGKIAGIEKDFIGRVMEE